MNKKFYLEFVAALVIIVIGSTSGWLPFNKLAAAVVKPFGISLTRAGQNLGFKFDELFSLGKLGEHERQLEAENAQLKAALSEAEELRLENEQLREQLKFIKRSGYNVLGADIVNYQPDSIRKLLRINRGSKDGIAPNQPVLAAGNLVGITQEVRDSTTDVALVTDADFRALVTTQSNRVPGIVKGQAGGLLMERIPQDQAVKNGEAIVTSGLDGVFPAGLRVGEVLAVNNSPESIFQTAQIEPAVDIERLRVVVVIVGKP
ncbi:rod shape-determining protein MreC [Candidatus Microgenomates bacterium]|nr:rod shape-determining protein MreC [Candidatus Microgenomates bacterium]